MITLKYEKIDPLAITPKQATPGSAGFDLYSIERKNINPGDTVMIRTGIRVEIPDGHFMYVSSKSGLAAKHGLSVLNSPGLIDNDYRGEIIIIMNRVGQKRHTGEKLCIEKSNSPIVIDPGDKIAQFVVLPYPKVELVEGVIDSVTVRGEGGFGSTGR